MFFLMYGIGGVLAVIGIILAVCALLYILIATGILGTFFGGIANAIASFFMGLLAAIGNGLVALLRIIAIPALIIGGIILLILMIRKTYFK